MNAKKLALVSAVAFALFTALPTFAVANYIEIPPTFTTELKASVGEVFSDLSVPIVLVISLPIAFWFIAKVVSLVRGGLTARGRRA